MVKTKKRKDIPFHKKLILNQYLFRILGIPNFDDLKENLSDPRLETIDEEGRSTFSKVYWQFYNDKSALSEDELAQYDINIINYLQKINDYRTESIQLKYYQYFSLLFVEVYLDRYFGNKERLRQQLNEQLAIYIAEEEDSIPEYQYSDMNKLAAWNATGSGKTLLMHLNYYQIQYYMKKYNVRFEGSYILLTPNEGLSNQHKEEFEDSGINASTYDKQLSRMANRQDEIQVIENTKLGEKDGDKTVSVFRFGSTNVVFVDEGHRGATGDTWYRYKNQLCEDGFSFEYSATFGQAIRASGNKDLENEYAKCIYFDYSYRYFYNDGFGKDYLILNLEEDRDGHLRNLYLTASLLSYYQQKQLYIDHNTDYKDFKVENPLMVFVGGSVNAVRTENKKKVSDVVDVLMFLNDFTNRSEIYSDIIQRILDDNTKILDAERRDVFAGKFDYLVSLGWNGKKVYQDMLKQVFHCAISGAKMHVENLKGVDGEIRLRLGENDAFGVINVGDTSELIKLCDVNGLHTSSTDYVDSLFDSINKDDSKINILIGSKKFTEGWNSWRVSTMGLMNVGKKEGSRIIQLFGRGVRLKGYDFSLKRSSAFLKNYPLTHTPAKFKYMRILETLNIFGIRADYMTQFKDYLEKEGVPSDKDLPFILEMPIINNLPSNKIITLKVKDNLVYKKDGSYPVLGSTNEVFSIVLDCYGKVQFQASRKSRSSNEVNKDIGYFDDIHLAGIDYDRVYFELEEYKMQKRYYNIGISRQIIKKLLDDRSWYRLLIPAEDLLVQTMNDFERFNQIAIALLKKYMDKYYTVSKSRWERPLLEYSYMDENDENFVKEDTYIFTVNNEEEHQTAIKFLEDITAEIKESKGTDSIRDFRKLKSDIAIMNFDISLYNPLIHVRKNAVDIKVTPVALNESEWDFVSKLREHLKEQAEKFKDKEVFLIRNVSKRGIGFFEDNGFYPDFIMWVSDDSSYRMIFIEPHGMRDSSLSNEKVQLHKKIKSFEQELSGIDGKQPVLESFILSSTKYLNIEDKAISKEQWNENHVLFMEDADVIEQLMIRIFDGK
ncbi:DEAD/DEAH box helicase family protein [Priestia endophytica]